MESKRNVYFKEFIGNRLSNPSRRLRRQSSEEHTHGVNSKRRKQSNPDFVTKLRRVNTADYEGIQPQDNTCYLGDDNLHAETLHSTRCDIPTQHASASMLLPPVLETKACDEMCLEIQQHALETDSLDEVTTQQASAPVLLHPCINTCAPDEISTQHTSVPILLEPSIDTYARDEFSTHHTSSSVPLQPNVDTITPDEMSSQYTSAHVLLQPGTDTKAPEDLSTQHTSASLLLQPIIDTSALDEIEISSHYTSAHVLLQPSTDINLADEFPTQHTPSLIPPQLLVLETGATSNMTNQAIPAPEFLQETPRIQSLSREEEIEICLQQIKADHEETIDGKQVNRITIEFVEETRKVPENENNINCGNILHDEGTLIDSSKQTFENCKKTRTKDKSKNIRDTRSNEKSAKFPYSSKRKPGSSKKTTENSNKHYIASKEIYENVSKEKPQNSKEIIFKHVDFLSDEELFTLTSSSWEGSEDTDSDTSTHNKNKCKNKKKKNKAKNKKQLKKRIEKTNKTGFCNEVSDTNQQLESEDGNDSKDESNSRKKKKKTNKAKERSNLKRTGKEYITKTGKVVEAKSLKENPCTPRNCPKKCHDISEERRKGIFEHYWSLSVERQRDWIVSHTKRENVKRKRTKDAESRRQFTYSYFINEGEGHRHICLKFLLSTLDIRQRFLHLVITTSQEGTSKPDNRGRGVPANKTPPSLLQSVRDYIQELPAVPSHYCRKNSTKCYLPQEYRNVTNLYKIYKQKNITEEKSYVGEKVFKNLFLTEFNISFHIPRKDKCVKCIKYENSPGEYQKEKETHMTDKEETYSRFKIHQALREHNNNVLCTTFDLQKVLNTPYGQSMLLYYSRKIATYNLTFYESITREGFCFLWNEVEGKRGANEVCTILAKYIQKVDERDIKHLLLYCDACPGQNRNKVVLTCIHKCLQKCKNITTLQINYLLPGHTFMPVDSMHSVIEKSVINTIVWAPSQWPTVCSLARKNPKPYKVEVLSHEDFEGWDVISEKYYKGNLTGKISRVRTATFKKNRTNHIELKYSMNIEAESELIEVLGKTEIMPKKIYKSKLPISKKKYSDLEKLCNNKTIPASYVSEYKLLPHAANVQDVLADTDIEDIQD